MILEDMKGPVQIENDTALEAKLNKRYGPGVNAFWLSHESLNENNNSAKLAILVNHELANVHYFPPGKHPGFQSQGSIPDLDVRGFSQFYMYSPEKLQQVEEIPNAYVVPFSDAVKVAKEFLERDELPKSIGWLEL